MNLVKLLHNNIRHYSQQMASVLASANHMIFVWCASNCINPRYTFLK